MNHASEASTEKSTENRRIICQTVSAAMCSLLILAGCVAWFPAKTSERASPQAVGTKNAAASERNDGIRILTEKDEKHGAFFTGVSNGISGLKGTANWADQVDFNLRCTGRPDIKRVTYTAHNCEFMKKTFLTQSVVDKGEYADYVEHAAKGEQQPDGSWVEWGFTSIGYVYSADFLEEVNLTNFGLKIPYTQTDYKSATTAAAYTEQMKRVSELRKAAYEKAFITAKIELDNGSVITKTIRIREVTENGLRSVSAYLA